MNAFVINLDNREDRLLEFKKINLPFDVKRFSAIKDDNGSLGCIKSHLECFKQFNEGINIIFEDDCVQISDINIMFDAIKELNDDWDILYLGAILHEDLVDSGKKYTKKITGGWGTHAIVYNGTKISDFILKFKAEEILVRRRNIDTFIVHEVQKNEEFKCYITSPQIFIQSDGYSDVINENRCYSK